MWPFFAPNLTILTWPSLVSVTHAAAHWTQRRFHRLPKLVDSGIPRNHVVCPIPILYQRGSFHLGRHLCSSDVYGIVGQVINVPVDVNNMVRQFPRQLDDDYTFNMNMKKNLIHKSVYLHGFVRKSVVRAWLTHLVITPLYKHYNMQVDLSVLDVDASRPAENDAASDSEPHMERVSVETVPESELLTAGQRTLLTARI
jgi:hypothetical protein